jgi:hypothetical protein
MKNLKEVQAQLDLLKAERAGVTAQLEKLRAVFPYMATADMLYQAEIHLSNLNLQVATLGWVTA